MGTAAPSDIDVTSVSPGTATQALPYQENYVEYLYGQNCGTYSVSFAAVDPSCDHTSLLSVDAKTGTHATNSNAFSQTMTLTSNNPSDVGEC